MGSDIPFDDRIPLRASTAKMPLCSGSPGKALVQTPILPHRQRSVPTGQIAAATSRYLRHGCRALCGNEHRLLSQGTAATMDVSVLREILRGGLLKIQEAGAMLSAVTACRTRRSSMDYRIGSCGPGVSYAVNAGSSSRETCFSRPSPSDPEVATAIKAQWEGCTSIRSCGGIVGASRLKNRVFLENQLLPRVAGSSPT